MNLPTECKAEDRVFENVIGSGDRKIISTSSRNKHTSGFLNIKYPPAMWINDAGVVAESALYNMALTITCK